jgi:DNA replication protein DnaC
MGKRPASTEERYPDFGLALSGGLQFPDDLQARMTAEMRLRESNIPPKYMEKSFENFIARDKKRKDLLESAQGYVNSFNLENKSKYFGLFFSARTGAGKTHLACAVLKAVILKGYNGVYCNVPRLLELLRELMFDRAHYDDQGFLARCEAADLLVIDDLGCETVTGWVQDRLYLLVNRRYEDMGRTIVTTNCGDATLRERIGERVESRLIEMCNARWVFPDEDYRMKAWGPTR